MDWSLLGVGRMLEERAIVGVDIVVVTDKKVRLAKAQEGGVEAAVECVGEGVGARMSFGVAVPGRKVVGAGMPVDVEDGGLVGEGEAVEVGVGLGVRVGAGGGVGGEVGAGVGVGVEVGAGVGVGVVE